MKALLSNKVPADGMLQRVTCYQFLGINLFHRDTITLPDLTSSSEGYIFKFMPTILHDLVGSYRERLAWKHLKRR